MSRLLVGTLTLTLLLAACMPLAAQENQTTASAPYMVQSGDNLWNLAGAKLYDNRLWEKIYEKNPFLKEPGRRFQKDGVVYVLVRPGENLYGLEELGIFPSFAPIDQLVRVIRPVQAGGVANTDSSTDYTWLWWLLGVLAALVLLAYLLRRLYRANPTQWRPVHPEGLRDENAAREHFNTTLADRYPGRQFVDVGPVEQVRLMGPWRTKHAGVPVPIPHNLDNPDENGVTRGTRAYRRRVRFTDNGQEEVLYSLQGCGNDARAGVRYLPGSNARVVEGWGDEPAAATAEPARVMTAAAGAGNGSETTNHTSGEIEVMFKREDEKHETHFLELNVQVETMTFKSGPEGTTLRFKPFDNN